MLTAGVHKDATTHLNYARGRLLQGTVRYAQVDAIYYLSRIRLQSHAIRATHRKQRMHVTNVRIKNKNAVD